MALTANDIVIFIPPTTPMRSRPPEKGWVIVVGASPEIIWMETGVRAVYSAIAAPAGVIRTAVVTVPADFTTWINQLVQPQAGLGPINNSGRSRGVVREVLLTGDPPTVLSLIVETPDGQWYLMAAAIAEIVA